MVSFTAKPRAKPVKPKPATSAETSTPNVPSAVMRPATSNVTRAAMAMIVAEELGLTAEDVLNARSLPELRRWVSARRSAK